MKIGETLDAEQVIYGDFEVQLALAGALPATRAAPSRFPRASWTAGTCAKAPSFPKPARSRI